MNSRQTEIALNLGAVDELLSDFGPADIAIFDFDGTLVNSEPLHEITFKNALADHGVTVDGEWSRYHGSGTASDLWHRLAAEYGLTADLAEIEKNRCDEFIALLMTELPLSHTLTKVKELYLADCTLVIASNCSRAIIETWLDSHGIRGLFSHIHTPELGLSKFAHIEKQAYLFRRAVWLDDLPQQLNQVIHDNLVKILVQPTGLSVF